MYNTCENEKGDSSIDKFNMKTRENETLRAAAIGIISNVFLSLLKSFAYLSTGSVSILADAINNLTDSLSSFVTLIGAKLSNMPADPEHPYGHGRLEYIAGLIVSVLVLFAGFEFIKVSIQKILNPKYVEYSILAISLMVLSCFIKFFMSIYYKRVGQKINSYPILAQSKDSISDVFVTGVVLLSILVYKLSGIIVDGFAGLLVSCFILKQGYELVRDTISEIIGKTNPEQIEEIEDLVLNHNEIIDVHDIVVVDFGPEKLYAWMDVELDDRMNLIDAHNLIDDIEREIYKKKGYHTSIHLDPVGTYSNSEKIVIDKLDNLIREDERFCSFHDLSITKERISVDVVVNGKLVKTDKDENNIEELVSSLISYGNLDCLVNIDKIFK